MDATLLTPLSRKPFHLTILQEHRIHIEYRGDDGTIPLQREQFETLFRRVQDGHNGFELDRLPTDAEPYATVLSLHPRFELDDRDGTLAETETPALVTSVPRPRPHTSTGVPCTVSTTRRRNHQRRTRRQSREHGMRWVL